jgi:chitodextrinase
VAAYDAAGNVSAQSSQASATTPAAPDTTPPVISSVASSGVTSSGATITWTTNEITDSTVYYGLTTSYGQGSGNPSWGTNHSVVLSGLTAGTTYHYKIWSWDTSANHAESGDYTFTTAPPPDTTPPVISSVTSSGISSSGATITWSTNEASDSQVEYGLTTSYGSSTPLNTNLVTNHSVTLSGLTAGATYHYRVKSKDAAANGATSGDYNFTTPVPPDTQAPTAPKGLKAAPISSTQINLLWTASTDNIGVTGYKIYQNNIQIGSTANTSYQATGLNANTSYSYRVAAYDAAGNTSAKSWGVTAKTQPSPSTVFTMGDRVQTTWKVTIRSTPSNSGTASGTQLKGATGRVVGGPVYSNLQWWWQIDFDSGVDGWVAQGKLKKVIP